MRLHTLALLGLMLLGSASPNAWAAPTVQAPPPAASAAAAAEPAASALAQAPAPVRVGDQVVLQLRAPRAGRSAAQRAREAGEALREALQAPDSKVHVEHGAELAVVYVGQHPVLQLTALDASLAQDANLNVHADRVAAALERAVLAERQRSAVARSIFNTSLAVLFAVLTFFLLRRSWQLGDRATAWLEEHPDDVPSLQLRSVELIQRSTLRTSLSLALALGRWVVLVGLIYAWLIATFSLFDTTRGLTAQLSGALLSPLAGLATRIAAAVPLVVVAVFALLILALVLRTVRLFFNEVARGSTHLAWVPRDLAPPTGRLVEVGVVIIALVLVAPIITGSPDGAASRMGLLLLGALALAATPLMAAAVVGVLTLFGRRLRVGDWVEFGSQSGRVTGIGLFDTTLRDASGLLVKVPHLTLLWRSSRVHGRSPRVVLELPLQAQRLSPALMQKLEAALANVGEQPSVRLLALQAELATLELSVVCAQPQSRAACWFAAQAVLQASHELAPNEVQP